MSTKQVTPEDITLPDEMFAAFAKACCAGSREERHKLKLRTAIAWMFNNSPADARLFHVGPELLEAIKMLRADHSVMVPHHEYNCPICAQADAAIAKAEGK